MQGLLLARATQEAGSSATAGEWVAGLGFDTSAIARALVHRYVPISVYRCNIVSVVSACS